MQTIIFIHEFEYFGEGVWLKSQETQIQVRESSLESEQGPLWNHAFMCGTRYILMTSYLSDWGSKVEKVKDNMPKSRYICLGYKFTFNISLLSTKVHGNCCYLSMQSELFLYTAARMCHTLAFVSNMISCWFKWFHD